MTAYSPEGALTDAFGRIHTDLRISVTDRCNFRCVYCMEPDFEFMPRSEILTYEEIARVAGVARAMGVDAVRLTGGEPLLRRGIPSLVRMLSSLDFDDLSLTTNGSHLGRLARELADAGLKRVNVSCDSLQPDRFTKIRRRGDLETTLRAMTEAERAGLSPVKVNVVLMQGLNDDELLDFAEFARRTGRIVRFIEFMPLDDAGAWSRELVVPSRRVIETIGDRWSIEPVSEGDPHAPAERFRFSDGVGEIGVVGSVTRPFCGDCNRMRLTADGAVRNCLFSHDEHPLRDLLRDGGTDEQIAEVLRRAVAEKKAGHGINEPVFLRPSRSMSMIGG